MKINILKYFLYFTIIFWLFYSIIWGFYANKMEDLIMNYYEIFLPKNIDRKELIKVNGYPLRFNISINRLEKEIKTESRIVLNDINIYSYIFNFNKIYIKSKKSKVNFLSNKVNIEINSYDNISLVKVKKNNYLTFKHLTNLNEIKLYKNNIQKKFLTGKSQIFFQSDNNNKKLNLRINSASNNNNFIEIKLLFRSKKNAFLPDKDPKLLYNYSDKIEIEKFNVRNENFNIYSDGIFIFDQKLHLNGQLNFLVENPKNLIGFLSKKKLIQRSTKKILNIINNIYGNSNKILKLPIKIKSGKIFVGLIPIYQLNPINTYLD